MKSETRGTSTSEVEVTHINGHGLWLLVQGAEYFLPYEQFPWFAEAKVRDILNVQLLHGRHLHWPALDVDLALDSLANPQNYPLVWR
jgi:hypothetical protein